MNLESPKMAPSPTLSPPKSPSSRPRRRPARVDAPPCGHKFGCSATFCDKSQVN